jgi:hypothetical protein
MEPSELLRLVADLLENTTPEEQQDLLRVLEAAVAKGTALDVEITDSVGLTDTLVVAVTLEGSGEVQQPTIQVTSKVDSSWNIEAPKHSPRARVASRLKSLDLRDAGAVANIMRFLWEVRYGPGGT